MMGFHTDFIEGVRAAIESQFDGTVSRFAKHIGVSPQAVSRLLPNPKKDGEIARKDQLEHLGKIIDAAGLKLAPAKRAQEAKDVCFAAPQIIGVKEYNDVTARIEPPNADDFLAVPLVEQSVAAGPGMVPEHRVRDWVIVWKWQESIRGKSNLVAVRVGKAQTSMVPTIHPGDILLVDRSDIHREPSPPGNIYLVQEPPPDCGLAVKRVVYERKNKHLQIVFYSDNAVEHPPQTYHFEEEYGNQIHHALIGRVVWAWSDMTRK